MEIHEALTILLSKNTTNLSQTKWNKLMFFIDGAYYTQFQITATNFKYIKMPFGPVPNDYRDIISLMYFEKYISLEANENISDAVRIICPPKKKSFIKEAETLIKSNENLNKYYKKVSTIFGDWTATRLSDFSHMMDAWKQTLMYEEINLEYLKKDKFLKTEYGISNFGKLLLKS